MKIAFDVDATLTDMNGFLKKRGKSFFSKRGKSIKNPDATTVELMYGATEEEMRAFWKSHFLNYCLTVQLKPDLKNVLDRLRKEGHNLHVISARIGALREDLLGHLSGAALINKFEFHGVHLDSYTFTDDRDPEAKLNVCRDEQIDVMVEDTSNHIERISRDLGIPVIVISTPENAGLELKNIIRIKDLSELEDAVKKAELLQKERNDDSSNGESHSRKRIMKRSKR